MEPLPPNIAKPFEYKTGSGAHLHFHIADGLTGKNLFPLKEGEEDWKGLGSSKTAIHLNFYPPEKNMPSRKQAFLFLSQTPRIGKKLPFLNPI